MELDSLAKDLLASIVQGDSLLRQVEILQRYKLSGGSQEYAIKVLDSLRNPLLNGELNDKILELMDFASGFCSPHMKIW